MFFPRDDPKTRRQKDFEAQCRQAMLEVMSRNAANRPTAWPYETIRTLNGDIVRRLRSSLFCWAALVAFVTGMTLLPRDVADGGIFILTLGPCLLLYPLIRFLFGGKDGVVPAVTAVIVEEVLKHQILKGLEKPRRRRRR